MNELDKQFKRLAVWWEGTVQKVPAYMGTCERWEVDGELLTEAYPENEDHLAAVLRRWLAKTHIVRIEIDDDEVTCWAIRGPHSEAVDAVAPTELLAVMTVANDVAEAQGGGA